MTSPEWEAANEDDADRWTRYQAHTGLTPDDGLVWRDRGVIIAQLTARIGELELACQKLRDDYQGALARETAMRGRIEALADEWQRDHDGGGNGRHGYHATEYGDYYADDLRATLAVAPAEDTTPAAPHAEDHNPFCPAFTAPAVYGFRAVGPEGSCTCSPAPVADPSAEDGS